VNACGKPLAHKKRRPGAGNAQQAGQSFYLSDSSNAILSLFSAPTLCSIEFDAWLAWDQAWPCAI